MLVLKWGVVTAIGLLTLPQTSRAINWDIWRTNDIFENNAVRACAIYLAKVQWDYDDHKGSFYLPLCDYSPALGSWLKCVEDMVLDTSMTDYNSTLDQGLYRVGTVCASSNSEFLNFTLNEYHRILHNATNYLKLSNSNIGNYAELQRSPISTSEDLRSRLYHAVHGYSHNLDFSNLIGILLHVYFLLVSAVFAFTNQAIRLGVYQKVLPKMRCFNSARGHFVVKTLNSVHCHRWECRKLKLLTGFVPTRLELAIMAGYVIFHTILLMVYYIWDPYCMMFESNALQKLRFFSDRFGIIALGQLPLLVVFSARNNILGFLTGVDYNVFMTFHKWIGRLLVFDATLHSILYTTYSVLYHSYRLSSSFRYWRSGSVAVIIANALVLSALGYIRKRNYDLFLYAHIFLSLLFLYFCWWHVNSFGWKFAIKVSLLIWFIERFIRIWKTLKFGAPFAKVHAYGHNLLKVSIPKSTYTSHFIALPGQYCFVTFWSFSTFLRSHPFTFIESQDSLIFVIRVKGGVTQKLWHIVTAAGGYKLVRVSLEGPYGNSTPIHLFNDVLLISGGSGLSGPLYHALHALRHPYQKQETRVIRLILVVADTDSLIPFYAELESAIKLGLHFQMYITRDDALKRPSIDGLKQKLKQKMCSFSSPLKIDLDVLQKILQNASLERPDMDDLISNYTKPLDSSTSLAVVSCGPPKLVDEIRDIISQEIHLHNDKSIQYFEELQCW